VPFKLVDKTDAPHDAGFKAFSGQAARLDSGAAGGGAGGRGGYALGGGGGGGGSNVSGLDEGAAGGGGGGGNARAKYLNKLPNAVIRNGKVIEVRSEIEAMLGGGGDKNKNKTPEVSVIDTHLDGALPMDFLSRPSNRRKSSSPTSSGSSSGGSGQSAAAAAAQRRAAAAAGDGEASSSSSSRDDSPNNPEEVTTLRVKGMDGYKMYIIKLRFDDTIGMLRRYVERACSGEDGADDPNVGLEFEIRGTYPPRVFDDEHITLRAAGLTPNAALLLKPVPTAA
jgi:hypothetical protein